LNQPKDPANFDLPCDSSYPEESKFTQKKNRRVFIEIQEVSERSFRIHCVPTFFAEKIPSFLPVCSLFSKRNRT
jgi:hypothetical protein